MVFEKIMQQHLLVAVATVDPSPAFQSRGRGRILVLVAAATVDPELQIQPSLPRLGMEALTVPALKSRARINRRCRDWESAPTWRVLIVLGRRSAT
jgi:hypothetical protein